MAEYSAQFKCSFIPKAVRIADFSKTTTLGNWSADILVRSRTSVNPEANRNVQCH